MQKYRNTLIAIREGTLSQEYKKTTKYRIDLDSEKKVKSLNTTFVIVLIVFLLLTFVLLYKIRQFRTSIIDSRLAIVEERK